MGDSHAPKLACYTIDPVPSNLSIRRRGGFSFSFPAAVSFLPHVSDNASSRQRYSFLIDPCLGKDRRDALAATRASQRLCPFFLLRPSPLGGTLLITDRFAVPADMTGRSA